MINSPQISVIIPVYKPADFESLRRSMAANSDIAAEWVVVDDGSGKEFDHVFESLNPDEVLLVKQDENRRQAAARNLGLAKSSGAWIKFLDVDDELSAGHLAALLDKAEAGVVPFAPTKHVFANGKTSINKTWCDVAPDSYAQLVRLIHRPFLHHCGALFPRSLLDSLGGYDESLITDEDGDLLIRVSLAGYVFKAVESANYLYIHGHGAARVSSDSGIEKLKARLKVCDQIEAAIAKSMGALPSEVCRSLAIRLDKIALSFWAENRETAKSILERASSLSPDYRSDERIIIRLLRVIGGPGAVVSFQRLLRRLRGRPAGGAQG